MSISPDELHKGFDILHKEWQQLSERCDWDEVKLLQQHDTRLLRIARRLRAVAGTSQAEEDFEEEDDEEALRAPARDGAVVMYDVVHSPSYQVPVLYLTATNTSTGRPPSIEDVYQILVPDTHKASMQAVGQLGALSLTEHPVTGVPAYFVHPCRTREAMEPVLEGKEVKPEEYVMLWLGTIGASVGLDVPLSLATRLGGSAA